MVTCEVGVTLVPHNVGSRNFVWHLTGIRKYATFTEVIYFVKNKVTSLGVKVY
jgi:hypothetical protein